MTQNPEFIYFSAGNDEKSRINAGRRHAPEPGGARTPMRTWSEGIVCVCVCVHSHACSPRSGEGRETGAVRGLKARGGACQGPGFVCSPVPPLGGPGARVPHAFGRAEPWPPVPLLQRGELENAKGASPPVDLFHPSWVGRDYEVG